jgi:hypothetical protein
MKLRRASFGEVTKIDLFLAGLISSDFQVRNAGMSVLSRACQQIETSVSNS